MIRLNIAHWWNVGVYVHPLTEDISSLDNNKKGNAYNTLLYLIESGMLRGSLSYAQQLIELLHSGDNSINLKNAAIYFEAAYKSELSTEPVYIVTPKGGYNVDILLENPASLFNECLLRHVPEAQHDVAQAAKCLAFEVPTAAAFHLHRLNEAVLHRYWEVFTAEKRLEKSSIGNYLSKMKSGEPPRADAHGITST